MEGIRVATVMGFANRLRKKHCNNYEVGEANRKND